jgi:hypothetical protein
VEKSARKLIFSYPLFDMSITFLAIFSVGFNSLNGITALAQGRVPLILDASGPDA